MKYKKFRIAGSDIKELIPRMGACLASDKITVDGMPVGYMCRDEPSFEYDTGWCFFSGTEDEEYANNPDNLAYYEVNTIVNYDSSIIAYLSLETGTELLKQVDGTFKLVSPL